MDLAGDRTMGGEMRCRAGGGVKVLKVLRSEWREKSMSVKAEMSLFEGTVVQKVFYECEA